MVKNTQTICRQIADELLSVFDHFVKLAFKGLKYQKIFSRGIKWGQWSEINVWIINPIIKVKNG